LSVVVPSLNPSVTAFRRELRPMLHIALPLVLAEVGWMVMGLVDTVMVGHLPDASVALSASALAQVLYNTFAFGVGGVLLGLDATIAQAHGAGDVPAANKWMFQGILLSVALAAFLMGMFELAPLVIRRLHTDAVVIAGAIPTLRALSLGTLPLLVYFALRRYLQAFNHVRIIAATLVTANLVNLLFDWLLIFGHRWHIDLGNMHLTLGWSALGVVGSGIATSLARLYQAGFLIVALRVVNRRQGYGVLRNGLARSLRPHWESLRKLVALGGPSGATILVEIAVFCLVTAAIAMLGPVALAGHEIALNCISFTFMIPLGISAAASVRVGQAIGRGSAVQARAAGWAGIALGAVAMACSSLLFLSVPGAVAGAFTRDSAVIGAAVPLLIVAAFFQFCDGLQITAIGALRGAGDTLSGLITHLCCYWLLGLPLGMWLCFRRGMGARGLWLGLSLALIIAGVTLMLRWRSKRFLSEV
jgi:MATE family multidrug resistance protein